MNDIKEECLNRWPGIFQALGIQVGESGHHCACPICGPGKNGTRFRMDDRGGTGTWICNHCGSGDGVSLIMKVLGVDFKEAVIAIRGVLGSANISKPQPEKKADKKMLRKTYTESEVVCTGDPVSQYLTNRGIKITSNKLRYHPACYEPETHTKMPAMLAAYTLQDGTAVTIHRTYLTLDGRKANVKNTKKLMPTLKPMAGGAIRLFDPVDGLICVAEGIETALAVHEQTNKPAWSLVSWALMEAFEPPIGVKTVLIFADNDLSYTGQKAAYTLANKLVVKNQIEAKVFTPKNTGDFLDILNDNSREV